MEQIEIGKIDLNTGQIEGLPKNPRFIKDGNFKQLVKSIQDDPDCNVILDRWEKFTGKEAVKI